MKWMKRELQRSLPTRN